MRSFNSCQTCLISLAGVRLFSQDCSETSEWSVSGLRAFWQKLELEQASSMADRFNIPSVKFILAANLLLLRFYNTFTRLNITLTLHCTTCISIKWPTVALRTFVLQITFTCTIAAIPVGVWQLLSRSRYCYHYTRTDAYKFSFFPRTVHEWNSVTPHSRLKLIPIHSC